MAGDCPNFAMPWKKNGTVPLSEAILLDGLRQSRTLARCLQIRAFEARSVLAL